MKKTFIFAGVILAQVIFWTGCQSVPENIPEDLDARQLIQLGQDNYDTKHYMAAQKYFNTVLERFGDDPKHYIEAKYELGHLFLKQKKYRAAYNNFTEIQEIYENVPIGLPGAYKILCGIELAKIPQEKLDQFKASAQSNYDEPEDDAQMIQEQKADSFQDEPQEAPVVQESPAANENSAEPESAPEEKAEEQPAEKSETGAETKSESAEETESAPAKEEKSQENLTPSVKKD